MELLKFDEDYFNLSHIICIGAPQKNTDGLTTAK